jgi:hypothetical protein
MRKRWILLPVLTGKENDKLFLQRVTKDTSRAVVVYIIDSDRTSETTFGDFTTEVQKGETLLDEIESVLTKRKIATKLYSEWGATMDKLDNIARVEQVDAIVVMDDHRKETQNFIKKMKRKLAGIEVEVVKK